MGFLSQRKVGKMLNETGLSQHDEGLRALLLPKLKLDDGSVNLKVAEAAYAIAYSETLAKYAAISNDSIRRQFVLLAKREHPWAEYDYPAYAKAQVFAQLKA